MRKFSIIRVIALLLSVILTRIEASEVLVFRNDSMPWCGTVDGQDSGIAVDILNELTKNGGPIFKFEELPWPRAQKMVHKTPGTAIIPFTRTVTREKNHLWIVNLVPNQVRLTLAKNSQNYAILPSPLTISNARSLVIGVIRGSAIIPTLKELGLGSQLLEVGKVDQLAYMLNRGRIDVMAESKWVDNYAWRKIGQKSEYLVSGPNVGEVKHIYLAAALDFPPNIAKEIRDAMGRIQQNGKLEKVLNKWR